MSRSAAQRGLAGAVVIERPEVAQLLRWVLANWPGSLPAVAGAMAGARRVQLAGPADLAQGGAMVVEEIQRARSRIERSWPSALRVLPIDPAQLRAVQPAPAAPAAPSRLADALDWMLGFVDAGVRPPQATRLRLEADVEAFLDWYVDHLGRPAAGQIIAMPAGRSLSPKRRLSARLTDPQVHRLIAGPPGSRACPTERAWRQGMGYWTIVALLSWAQGGAPPDPHPPAQHWWASRLPTLGNPASCQSGVPAPTPVWPEAGRAWAEMSDLAGTLPPRGPSVG